MRRKTALLILGTIFAASAPVGVFAHGSCPSDGGHTASGSCKESRTSTAPGAIHCGATGQLPIPSAGGVRFYENSKPDASNHEIEACNDQGPGNTQGRAVVRARNDAGGQGVRASLDTDDGQPFPAGYINAQVGTTGSGVWCNEDTYSGTQTNDGYAQPWGTPGTDGTAGAEGDDLPGPAECFPTA